MKRQRLTGHGHDRSSLRTCLIISYLAALAATALPVLGDEPAPPPAHPKAGATDGASPPTTPQIDPRAAELLRDAGKFIGDAKSLSFSADVWEDVVSTGGRKLQSQRTTDVAVRRPDRVVAHTRSERKSRDSYYDGKTLTVYDPTKNMYGVIADAPKTIDETIDFVSDRFGVSMPLSDLIVSDVNRDMIKNVRRGDYLGVQPVGGSPCHHLGFVQDDIDWQIWIDAGDRPLVRRLLITYKNEDQAPQFSATIAKWDVGAALPDYAFQFRAPAGASKIDVLPAKAAPADTDAANVAAQKQPPSNDQPKQPERKD